MKRYNIMGKKRQDGTVYRIRVIEHPEGELVKHEDVKHAVESYNDWVERGIWKEDGCNCLEVFSRSDNADPAQPYWWICPAHGYKRL